MQTIHFEMSEEGLKIALDEIAKKREKSKNSKFSLLHSANIVPDGLEVRVSDRSVSIVEYPPQTNPECEDCHSGESCELEDRN